MGFAGGVFLMMAIQSLGDLLDGAGGALVWVQLIGSVVVVGVSVAVLAQSFKGGTGTRPGGGAGPSGG